MKQADFDQLLAWTMLSALNSSVVEQQLIRGRDLTDQEYQDCHKKAHQHAELLQREILQARASFGR